MSELLFLGTGAADWDISQKGTSFRRNSAALLNGELLLDCGPHIFDFAESCGNGSLFDGVTDVLITHDHSDHICAESLLRLAERRKLRVCCDGYIRELVGLHPNITYVSAVPFEEFNMGDYRITAVPANHDMLISGNKLACHYIIRTPDVKTVFYGLDGAWFLRPSWEEMKKHHFDIMVLDCTVGDKADWRSFEHNSVPMLRIMTANIKDEELLAPGGKLVASHLARTLHASNEETVKILNQLDMTAAYDGMTLSF